MTCVQFRSLQSLVAVPAPLSLMIATCALVILTTASAAGQLANNQTNGFGSNRLVTFTYLQNFDCRSANHGPRFQRDSGAIRPQ